MQTGGLGDWVTEWSPAVERRCDLRSKT